jgi:hypothetical protein
VATFSNLTVITGIGKLLVLYDPKTYGSFRNTLLRNNHSKNTVGQTKNSENRPGKMTNWRTTHPI